VTVGTGASMLLHQQRAAALLSLTTAETAASRDVVVPFLIGTAVGGVAGALAGTLLSSHTTHLVAALIEAVGRRGQGASRDELRFELMLQ